MEANFLLVCEGQTDFFAIEQIAKNISGRLGRKIRITPLSPQKDSTTGSWPNHGWSAIRNWCRLYGTKSENQLAGLDQHVRAATQRRNWRALIKLSNAAGLIIQMDTDIAEKITDLQPFNSTTLHRKDYCKDAILLWLNEPSSAESPYLALTSYALEAWLLATHDPTDPVFSDLPAGFSYEDIPDLESRLLSLGYPSEIKKRTVRFSKKERHYKHHSLKISANLTVVRQRCASADELCRHLENTTP